MPIGGATRGRVTEYYYKGTADISDTFTPKLVLADVQGSDGHALVDWWDHSPSWIKASQSQWPGAGRRSTGHAEEPRMPSRPLTVLFMPESAYGPTNNCIGIGDVLRRQGHRVVFAAEASWKGKLEPLGFTEDLVDLSPPASGDQDAGQFWKDFVAQTAPEFRKPTIEQLETWIKPVWEELAGGARYCHDQLRAIVDRVRPDVIVEDNVVGFPALATGGVPFVRIVSCNPLEIKSEDVPPAFSGYPAGDRTGWAEFRAEYDRVHRPLWQEFNDWYTAQGAAPLPDLEFIGEGDVNLYVYPELADYRRDRPLGRPGTGSTLRSAGPTRSSRSRPGSPAATGR